MFEDLLAAQDGVVTRDQAEAHGVGKQAINRLIRSGRWERRGPTVYFACDRPFTDRARIRCAVWASGDRATVSGLAAAFWLGLEIDAPDLVDITTPRSGRSRPIPGTRIRRRELSYSDVIVRNGVRVTALPLTVLECAVRPGGTRLMDAALQRHTSLLALKAAHARNPGRTGAAAAGALLRSAEGGARSEAERLFARLLTAAEITGWIANYRWGPYVLDFAFPDERLAIEIDGWAFHSDPDAFHRDRTRQNAISTDWTVLRYTWADLMERPQEVLREVTAVLNRIRC